MRAGRQHPRRDRPRRHGRPVLSAAICPRCNRPNVRRSHRAGPLEHLFGLFGYYPFRCQACGHRFWRKGAGATPAKVPVERRDFDRHTIRIPVTIVGVRGTFEAVATDLSVRGCALETTEAMPTSGPFALTLQVAGAPIEIAAARARYVQGTTVGVEFRQITPSAQTRLAEYVGRIYAGRQV